MGWVAEVSADGPSVWLRHGEVRGTAVVDAMGGAAGTYSGGVTLGQAGVLAVDVDTAAAFDGTGFASFADRTAFDTGNRFSIEWLGVVTRYGDGAGNGGGFTDGGANEPITRFANALDGRVILRQNGVTNVCTSTAAVRLGELAHLVWTYDGTTARIYYQGADVSGATTRVTFTNGASPFVVGAADGGTLNFLVGRSDETVIYKGVVLSPARVAAHWSAVLEQPPVADAARVPARLPARVPTTMPGRF